MADEAFYSDRTRGPQPRTLEDVPPATWAGMAALIERRIEGNWLAKEFPEHCVDGNGIVGTNERDLRDTISAYIPDLIFPLDREEAPDLDDILDLVDFIGQHIAEPKPGSWHQFFRHHELSFDERAGRESFRNEVDRLFARGRIAYTVDEKMRVRRMGSPESRAIVAELNSDTDDEVLNELIAEAHENFYARSIADRRRSLEKLWDAFERLKTLEPDTNKRARVTALLDRAATGRWRDYLNQEALQLTEIGNELQIRHFETTKEQVPAPAIDYLFTRMSAWIVHILRVTDHLT